MDFYTNLYKAWVIHEKRIRKYLERVNLPKVSEEIKKDDEC